ncbi:MAG: TolC family protein, partial [Halioglobus sp.]|nr:TolC family protein [Halioglobus sp.]
LQLEAAKRGLCAAMGIDGQIDIPLSNSLRVPPDLPDEETLLAGALQANGRVVLARIAIERARRAHDLARAEAVPELVASIGPRYSDPENETTLDLGVGLEIPLFDRNQGNIRAALADRLSAAAALQEVQLELMAEISEAWAAFQAARVAVSRYDELLLPKAEQTLSLTQQAYDRGKADYLRVLDAQQVVIESRIAYIDTLERLHESGALLRELAPTGAPWRDAPRSRGAEEGLTHEND